MKKNLHFLFVLVLAQLFSLNHCLAEGRGSAAGPLYGSAAKEGEFTLYAYAQNGEQIDWNLARTRSSGGSDAAWTISVYSPTGFVTSCTINSSTIGTACTNAKIGITAGTAGIWTLVATPAGSAGNDVLSYDLSVYTAASVPIPGRVYTYSLHGQDKSSPLEPDFTLYFLNPDGYEYSATYKQLNGLNYTIVSDNYGVRTTATSCVSSYRSVSYTGAQLNLGPDSANCGSLNKIFFNAFDAALPASAPRFNVGAGSGQITEPLVFTPFTPTLSSPVFTGNSACIQSGNVSFTTTHFSGTGFIYYDVNNNGVYTDPGDVIDTVNFSNGANSFSFNGLDALGNPIPISQPIKVQVSINRIGETHFVMSDMEVLAGGIEVTRLNGTGAPDNTLYWDDSNLPATNNCSLTAITNGVGGINSTGGVHGWTDCGGCSPESATCGSGINSTNTGTINEGSWGNQRLIDNWTYIIPVGLTNVASIPGVNNPDFGDLPTGWPMSRAYSKGPDSNGDCILDNNDVGNTTSVWAGASENFEATPNNGPSNATGDTYDDGLTFPAGAVNPGTTYIYSPAINSNAGNKTVYYALWFDWNNNHTFTDDVDCNSNPAFYTGSATTPPTGGITTIPISVCVPSNASSTDYKIRLIVSDSIITFGMDSAGVISNGEVEDYQLPLVILPVTFGAVSAKQNDCSVLINFETIYEYNNSSFKIERSTDGNVWETIGTIASTSTGNELTKYQFVDVKAPVGQNYYRIKQTDKNGAYQYSGIMSVISKCNGNNSITSYPNPVNDKLIVSLPAGLQNVQIRIINGIGQMVTPVLQSAGNTMIINTQKFSRGLYILHIIQNGSIIYQDKFIKQ